MITCDSSGLPLPKSCTYYTHFRPTSSRLLNERLSNSSAEYASLVQLEHQEEPKHEQAIRSTMDDSKRENKV